jgi:hypothetical protein
MKIRVMLFGALALGFAGGLEAMAGPPIALPSGNFSWTAQGTEATCATTSCPVINIIEIGSTVRDKAGNACGTHVGVVTPVPIAGLPQPTAPITHVMHVIHYDPNTGTGDMSLTEYFGGSCNGAALDSTGATKVVDGTLHFVVSNGGNRIDHIATSLNIQLGGPPVGAFSLSFTERRQDNSANAQ